jgi:hypothetical protein
VTEQPADPVEVLFQAFRRLDVEQRRRLLARIDRTWKHGIARRKQGEA